MTDRANNPDARIARRYRAERRFKALGLAAILFSVAALFTLVWSIAANAWHGFQRWDVTLTLELTRDALDMPAEGELDESALRGANYQGAIRSALRKQFPDVSGRRDRRALNGLLSDGAAYTLIDRTLADPSLIGRTVDVALPLSSMADTYLKGRIDPALPEAQRPIKDNQIAWLETLRERGMLQGGINWDFFTQGNSRDPQVAGIWGAVVGSFYLMLVTFALSFPLGVAAAIYLEEFAPKNRWTDIIEVNINNLAAVPSIVFGLLGLAVFLNFFGLPRSAPLVGGMVLALMTLPTIIIASRAALKAVPPSIREGALGVGASKMQAVFHHVLPLAMPGIMTGTIIGLAQALGETAPLLMIGMVAFVVDVPPGLFSGGLEAPAAVLPVQIFIWADLPERAFVEKTAAAIVVLLGFLVLMNLLAIVVRKRFERRW